MDNVLAFVKRTNPEITKEQLIAEFNQSPCSAVVLKFMSEIWAQK